MKKLFLILLFVTEFMIVGKACDIKLVIAGEKKETYKAEDVIVINVTVTYIHRICELELSDTRITCAGMKIVEATEWKEIQPGTYSKDLKVTLLQDGNPDASLKIVRKCSADGGMGLLKIKKSDK
ncbi:MAG: hypothetical protein WC833_10865 [Bacteroidales bacterium]|jgi:hypothetical protein